MVEPVVRVHYDYSLITQDDLYLFNEGSHFRLYEKLGAHPLTAFPESREPTLPCGRQMRSRFPL